VASVQEAWAPAASALVSAVAAPEVSVPAVPATEPGPVSASGLALDRVSGSASAQASDLVLAWVRAQGPASSL